MPGIFPVVTVELNDDEYHALTNCNCAVCRRLREEMQSGNHLVLFHLDGDPAIRSVGKRRPLARPAKNGINSNQS